MTTSRSQQRSSNSRSKVRRKRKRRDVQAEVIIERWKHTRYWAVWVDDDLLAVVVYKKGALAIRERILQ